MMNQSQIAEVLKTKDNILIVSHRNPDGDTLGSSAALCRALRLMGKEAYMYPNPDITEKYIPFIEDYLGSPDYCPEFTVSVDVADQDMLCKGFSGEVDMNIDHHPTNPEFAGYNCICEKKAACGEIITEIIEAMEAPLDKDTATLLYIAVTTDTGYFMYANTNSDTLDCAGRLLDYGADNMRVVTVFFRKVSKARIALEGFIYNGMEYYCDGRLVVVTITKEMMEKSGATENDTTDIAGLAGRVDTMLVGVIIKEKDDGTCKVSLRSGPEVNSYEICMAYGGGGHSMAAGFTYHGPADEVKQQLVEKIGNLL